VGKGERRDLMAYLCSHHLEVVIGEDGGFGVIVPLRCKHLRFNKKTREARCAVYDKRPKMCRDFLCEAAKE